MRAARIASVLLVPLAFVPACSNDVPSKPLAVSWLEWSDSVTVGIPFGVRVYGEITQGRDFLRINVRVHGDTATIQPYSVAPPPCTGCAVSFFSYDTLVWVPAIAATAPRSVAVRAPTDGSRLVNAWPARTFGSLIVSPDTVVQPLTRSVGEGSGFQDSFGCYVINRLFHTRLVSADQSPSWAPGFTGFVYGRVDPVAGSPCVLDAPVILVDSIVQ